MDDSIYTDMPAPQEKNWEPAGPKHTPESRFKMHADRFGWFFERMVEAGQEVDREYAASVFRDLMEKYPRLSVIGGVFGRPEK